MSEMTIKDMIENIIDENKLNGNKRVSFFNELFAKIKKGNKESYDVIKLIDKNYNEEIKKEKEQFEILKQNISAIEKELDGAIKNYYDNYNIDVEEKKLADSKEKGVTPKILIYRKETHDNNFKYDRILKEEKDVLKTKQDAYDDFEKTYKSRIFDLEKKKRYEINKEKATIIANSDDLQKKLLNTNSRKEIKDINQNIQSIRMQGLQKEKEIKLAYLQLINEENLKYEIEKNRLKNEIKTITKDYAIKKKEIEFEKKNINLRYNIELDKYDFGSKRAINNLNQIMIKKKNSLIIASHEEKRNLSNLYREKEIECIKHRKTMNDDLISVMGNNCDSYFKTIDLARKVSINNYLEAIDNNKKLMKCVIDYFQSLLISIHQEYVGNVINNEYENMKLFVSAKYNFVALYKYDAKDEIAKLENLFEEFKIRITEDDQEHAEKIKTIFKELNIYFEKTFEEIITVYQKDDIVNNYQNQFFESLNEIISSIKQNSNRLFENELESFTYVNEINEKFDTTNKEVITENNKVDNEHMLKNQEIDEEVKIYYATKDSEKKAIEDELKEIIASIILDYDKDINLINEELESAKNQIQKNMSKDKQDLELEYATQVKLLK